jgi:hypothetical protein
MTPAATHCVRCIIATAGPVSPGGGTAPGSTRGGLIAHADGLIISTATELDAAPRSPARIID